MFPYIIMNFIISLFSFKEIIAPKYLNKILSFVLLLILILFVGLRYKVGGDWGSYDLIYYEVSKRSFSEFIYNLDSLFYALNYFISLMDLENGFILVNFTVSIFVFISFYRFIIFNDLNPISFVIFFPFVIMVIMGYTKQSIALSFLFLILSLNLDQSKLKTLILSIFAGFFHFSGFFLSLIILNNFFKKNKDKNFINNYTKIIIILILLSLVIMIYLSNDKIIQKLIYFLNNYSSTMSLIRNFPIFLSCALLIIYREFFKNVIKNYDFYFKLSIFGILIYFSTYFFSTISDRLLVYLIPLTVIVFSKLFMYFSSKYLKFIYLSGVNIFFICFLFGWLTLGNSGNSWLPYDILFEPKSKNDFYKSLIKDLPRFEFVYEPKR